MYLIRHRMTGMLYAGTAPGQGLSLWVHTREEAVKYKNLSQAKEAHGRLGSIPFLASRVIKADDFQDPVIIPAKP